MPSVKLISLGCSKNTVDSEVILGNLKAEGWTVIPENSPRGADVTVINTCGFILDAKQESIDTILAAASRKRPGRKLVVTGCLVQRYREQLQAEIPDVDAWIGVNDLPAILRAVRCVFGERYALSATPSVTPRDNLGCCPLAQPYGIAQHSPYATRASLLSGTITGCDATCRHLTTPKHYAYLKVSEGCNRQCAFCAIPGIRGKHRSRPKGEILAEARNLAEKGVKELILVAQDLCSYGIDINGKRTIASLVRELCRIDGIHWVRLQYLYPHAFPEDLLEVMAREPKVCKYVDIPLQHINTGVLKSMLRATTRQETLSLLKKFRMALPEDAAFRTTLITGFPTETPKAYAELKAFIKDFRFDRLGVFPYSLEENTPAEKLGDPVPQKEKERRAQEIMDIQEGISLAANRARIGKTYEVLIDRREGEFYVGRTQYDSPEVDNEVLIRLDSVPSGKALKPGCFYPVIITSAEAFDLYGNIAQ